MQFIFRHCWPLKLEVFFIIHKPQTIIIEFGFDFGTLCIAASTHTINCFQFRSKLPQFARLDSMSRIRKEMRWSKIGHWYEKEWKKCQPKWQHNLCISKNTKCLAHLKIVKCNTGEIGVRNKFATFTSSKNVTAWLLLATKRLFSPWWTKIKCTYIHIISKRYFGKLSVHTFTTMHKWAW